MMEQTHAEQQDHLLKLMSLLKDSSKDVYGPYIPGRGEFAPRWRGMAGLVELGAVAVEPLCTALQDNNSYTRRFAAEALKRIGDPRAVAPLIVALQASDHYATRYIAEALAVLGDERAVGPLYKALQTPDIAREALAALHAVLQCAAGQTTTEDLRLVASLADNGVYATEVPDTDGGYVVMERVEYWQDHRPIKQLAQQELLRRDPPASPGASQ
jgi:HEAT repeat protein